MGVVPLAIPIFLRIHRIFCWQFQLQTLLRYGTISSTNWNLRSIYEETTTFNGTKRLETDIWIIALVTLGVFLFYAATGKQLMSFVANSNISVIPRLLLNAGVQFGVAGLGITIVCILRKESFTHFGLIRKNIFKAIIGTIICFIPSICYIFLSGQFNGYQPFNILITDDVIASGIPFSILGMALIVLVWGFFEGFNYVVICDKNIA